MSMGPMPPVGSDAGSGPDGEDPRNLANEHASGTVSDQSSFELKEVEGLSLGRIVWRRFLRHRAAMASAAVLLVVVILAFSAVGLHVGPLDTPGWWRWSFTQIPDPINGGVPSADHPFGQDTVGHDVFAQVMRGIQQSLMIMVVSGAISTVIGTVLGAVAGYYGGWIDAVLMRVTDIVIVVPLYLIAAIVGTAITRATQGQSNSFLLGVFLGLLVWTTLARLVRGEVLALREREFVEAAQVAGASPVRIIFRHILPNAIGVIIVSATLTMSATIITEAAISFLGFGVQPPDTSLGKLIGDNTSAFSTRPYLFWWPALFIVLIALCINFIGDGLRDAFDPRQRRGLGRAARKELAETQAAQVALAQGEVQSTPAPVDRP